MSSDKQPSRYLWGIGCIYKLKKKSHIRGYVDPKMTRMSKKLRRSFWYP